MNNTRRAPDRFWQVQGYFRELFPMLPSRGELPEHRPNLSKPVSGASRGVRTLDMPRRAALALADVLHGPAEAPRALSLSDTRLPIRHAAGLRLPLWQSEGARFTDGLQAPLRVLSQPARVSGSSLGGPPFLYNDRSDKGGNLYLYSALSGQDGKGRQSARGIGAVAGQLLFAALPDARRQRRNRLGIEQWPGGMVPPGP